VTIPDPPCFVQRPDVEKMVKKTLLSGTCNYDVIVGNPGTGKSTIIEKVAGSIGGVVYVHIPLELEVDNAVADALIDALHWEEPHTAWTTVLFNPSQRSGKPCISAIDYHLLTSLGTDNSAEATAKIHQILKEFELLAQKFHSQTNRPAVLVFDNIDIVAARHPRLLETLQGYAKKACDHNLYKVVFVCSDGVAPPQMKSESIGPSSVVDIIADTAAGNSSWSRGPSIERFIGDLTESQAKEYLLEIGFARWEADKVWDKPSDD
jgi:hypothetical protein